MRIAIFSECYTPVANGVVTSIQTLRDALRAQGHTVAIFAPGAPQPDDDADVFRLPELPFPDHPYHFARPFARLKVDFAAMGFQVVHAQHPFMVGRLGADLAHKHGLPMVYTAHSLYDTMAACARSPVLRKVGIKAARGVVRRFCAKADCVIVPSDHTRDALRAEGVRARFCLVPSGVPAPEIHPGGRERIRARLGVAPETPVILCVGRFGPEKRVDLLLRAVALLAHGRPLPENAEDFRVVLVGDGQRRVALEELTAELGLRDRVIFAGTQPHSGIGDWYAAADLFALPSPAETQGLVLVEAMAAGLPCVAVDSGGPREVIVQNETGLRVPFHPNAFARALAILLCDPERRQRLGANGLVRARAYSPDAMANGVLSVYESVLRSPRRPVSSSARPRRLKLHLKPGRH